MFGGRGVKAGSFISRYSRTTEMGRFRILLRAILGVMQIDAFAMYGQIKLTNAGIRERRRRK